MSVKGRKNHKHDGRRVGLTGRLCKRHKSSDASEFTLPEKKAKPTSIFVIPPEAWVVDLLPLLAPKDLCALSLVCRYFYILSTDNYIWRHKYQNNWGLASFDYECKALAWLKLKTPDQKSYFKRKEHIFWKQRFGFRARFGEEKIIVRIQYDNGTSFKTLLCTKSDLAGEICHKMAAYSTCYRYGSKLYKSLLENGTLHYTEELDYLVSDHSSFQLFQPNELQELSRWLSPVDTLGVYSDTADNSRFVMAQYYDSLNLLELEFQPRVQPLKYSCKVNEVFVTRTILVDCCWDVRQIIHVILTQMHPQIEYRSPNDRDSYRLAWYGPQRNSTEHNDFTDHDLAALIPLKMDQTLQEQGIHLMCGPHQQPQEVILLRENEWWWGE